MQLDDLWASLFLASLPPASGLATHSCSCGQEFASGSFSLRLTTRLNLRLRLASSPPSGSSHPDSSSNLPSTLGPASRRLIPSTPAPQSHGFPAIKSKQVNFQPWSRPSRT